MWSMKEHLFTVDYLVNNKEKRVRVYLPKDYENSEKNYPVVYFHDGQAVFFGKTQFGTGSWEVLDTLVKMEQNNVGESYIAVAIDNACDERPDEFLPFKNSLSSSNYPEGKLGGKANFYADFLVDIVKKFIDENYRTKPEESSIIGSSFGGVVTAYIISKYPNVFKKAGVFSLASWIFAKGEFFDYLEKTEPNKDMKYYVYVGGKEGHYPEIPTLGQNYVDDTLEYYKFLVKKGVPTENIELKINLNNAHNETAWSCYVEPFLLF